MSKQASQDLLARLAHQAAGIPVVAVQKARQCRRTLAAGVVWVRASISLEKERHELLEAVLEVGAFKKVQKRAE